MMRETAGRDRDVAVLRESGCPEAMVDPLSRAMDWRVECDTSGWSQRVLRELSPVLQERAGHLWRRQVATLLAAATAMLPLALLAAGYGIATAYGILSAWLPSPVAIYLVGTYAAFALATLGATYAMIPIVIDRSRGRLALARSWEVAR